MDTTSKTAVEFISRAIKAGDSGEVLSFLSDDWLELDEQFMKTKGLSMLSFSLLCRSTASNQIAAFMAGGKMNLSVRDSAGLQPLDYAVVADNVRVADFLIKNGATMARDFNDVISSIDMYEIFVHGRVYGHSNFERNNALREKLKTRALEENDKAMLETDKSIAYKRICYAAKLLSFSNELSKCIFL